MNLNLASIFKKKPTTVKSTAGTLNKAIGNKKGTKILGSPLLGGFTKRYKDLDNI